jgi:glycosyltransferase involved in cell wall biosynthesis
MRSDRFAVVIPAYQEAATIGDIVALCRAAADVVEVIVVDDGSSDATAERAEAAGAQVLRNAGNQGKGASLARGLAEAVALRADWVVTLDGDGQHRPADFPQLFACARGNPNKIVIGSRRADSGSAPRARYVANRIADFWVSLASGYNVDDSQSGFRVYPTALLRRLRGGAGMAKRFAFESEMLIEAGRLGVSTVAVPIPAIYTKLQRHSHFRPVLDITRIVFMVAGKILGVRRSRR